MYDAKKNEKQKKDSLKYSSIYDRAYFTNGKNESFISTKTSYIPSETLFFL
jgi:hypothetical protein